MSGSSKALELPDIPFTEIPPAADMIANSALGGAIMIGAPVDLVMDHNLVEEEIVFTRNGNHVSTTYGADIMDDPFNAVAWLANRLGAKGETLKPGDIVMTGGISTLIRPDQCRNPTGHNDVARLQGLALRA